MLILYLDLGVTSTPQWCQRTNKWPKFLCVGFTHFLPSVEVPEAKSLLPECPAFPPNLVGTMRVSKKPIDLKAVDAKYAAHFQPGGFYAPPDCSAKQKGQWTGCYFCQGSFDEEIETCVLLFQTFAD